MLLSVEAVTKVLFRWGIDSAFLRLSYDCADDRARQRLASSIFFFLLTINSGLLLIGLAAAPTIVVVLFDAPDYTGTLRPGISDLLAPGWSLYGLFPRR